MTTTVTISLDFLENLELSDYRYFTDILFVFTNRHNDFKVAKDVNNEVLDLYKKVKKNSHLISCWLDMMSYSPTPFETVNIDIKNVSDIEEKFLKLCKHTRGNKFMLVYSLQNLSAQLDTNNCIIYNHTLIKALDKEECIQFLNAPRQIIYTTINQNNENSIIVGGDATNVTNKIM